MKSGGTVERRQQLAEYERKLANTNKSLVPSQRKIPKSNLIAKNAIKLQINTVIDRR
jgi:hypothetical protein